jgi:hypothetical protein
VWADLAGDIECESTSSNVVRSCAEGISDEISGVPPGLILPSFAPTPNHLSLLRCDCP